jgi:hypothetical protein
MATLSELGKKSLETKTSDPWPPSEPLPAYLGSGAQTHARLTLEGLTLAGRECLRAESR